MFDFRNSRFTWKNSADREESGLHNRVHASAHAGLLSNFITIDHIELEIFLDDIPLHFTWQLIPNFLRTIQTVQKENATWFGVLEHIHTLKETVLVTSNNVRLIHLDEIRRADGFWSKT